MLFLICYKLIKLYLLFHVYPCSWQKVVVKQPCTLYYYMQKTFHVLCNVPRLICVCTILPFHPARINIFCDFNLMVIDTVAESYALDMINEALLNKSLPSIPG
jgi:hypothetical protein